MTPAATQQRLDSLAQANRVRIDRARIRRQIQDGTPLHVGHLRHPALAKVPVSVVLTWLPGWGPVRVRKYLRLGTVPGHRTVGQLSDRQRAVLVDETAGAVWKA